jgi:hypothetical protein
VPTNSKKPAADRALPANVAGIRLKFHFQTAWDETPSDGPSFWHVSADVHDLDTDAVTEHVGSFLFYRIEPVETSDLFGVMDGYDSDLGHIAEMVIDPATGEIDDALRDHMVGFEPDVLVLCRAELEENWRGFGLGAVLAGQAIKQLGHGCLGVVLQPASLLPKPEQDMEARKLAVKKISKAWEKIGFERFSDELMVLDLATTTLSESFASQSSRIRHLPITGEDK